MKEIISKTIDPIINALLSYATSREKISREYEIYIQSLNRKLYVFELEGLMVGCIGIEFVCSNKCEIKHIAVFPNKRGKMIGSKMIKYICDTYSLSFIFAETDKDAVEFYRKYGFEITSLGEKYPGTERFLCEYKVI